MLNAARSSVARPAPRPMHFQARARALVLGGLLGLGSVQTHAQTMPAAASAASVGSAAATLPAALQARILSLMREQQVPGLSLGVIEGGQIKYMDAWGWRDARQQLPMSPQTLMAIGSMSKSFTGVLAAMLVDDKRLDLDRPIQAYLPSFRLQDEYASSHASMRDLLIHDTGMPDYMAALRGPRFPDPQTLLRIWAHLPPSVSFRQQFQYSNIGYMVASQVQSAVAQQSWEELLDNKLLQPLGMTSSTAVLAQARASADVAVGHQWVQQQWRVEPPFDGRFAQGAGAIYSNVPDMLRYLQFRLDGYRVDGQALLPPSLAQVLDRPHIPTGFTWLGQPVSYGLGVQFSWRGHDEVVFHSGGIDDFSSRMLWMPARNIGVVVLSNTYAGVADEVSQLILDELRGPLVPAPLAQPGPAQRAFEERAQALAAAAIRLPAKPVPAFAALRAYAGVYEHPAYGALQIDHVGEQLLIQYGQQRAPLEHQNANVFATPLTGRGAMADLSNPLAGLQVSFSGDAHEPVTRLEVLLDPYAHSTPAVFVKVAPGP